MGTERNARRRLTLWKQNKGKCFYCKIDTILPKTLAALHRVSISDMGRKLKPAQYYNMATIDHLIPRYDIRRMSKNNTCEERTVLCCWKCNQDRAQREYNSLPTETLRMFAKAGRPAMFVLRDMASQAAKTSTPLTKPSWLDRILMWFREMRKKYEHLQSGSRQGEDRAAPERGQA